MSEETKNTKRVDRIGKSAQKTTITLYPDDFKIVIDEDMKYKRLGENFNLSEFTRFCLRNGDLRRKFRMQKGIVTDDDQR